MKPAPTRPKTALGNRLKATVLKRIWFVAIAFIAAGLVLILGGQLEQVVSKKSLPVPLASPVVNPIVTPSATLNATTQAALKPTLAVPKPAPTGFPITKPVTSVSPQPIAAVPPNPRSSVQTHFGHFPYTEDTSDRLVSIGKFVRENYEREEAVDVETAQAFQVMVTAARTQSVQLMGISGFRSIADQQLLFDKQIAKRGSAEAAAKLSAPPGHSEHHTGYAIDITDRSRTDVDLKIIFEETAAYQWLVVNAHQYGFEQSFPRNNAQGVNYEPWHWRFVASDRAAQVFAAARS
jgi:zinc D-Ala-D-Ala carboxypeptidase